MTHHVAIPLFSHRAEASASAPADMRRLVDAFLQTHAVAEEVRLRVRQCVTEAVTNAVRHAYGPGGSGPAELIADIERDLQVVVIDAGEGIRTDDDAPGQGLGLMVVAEYTDDLTLRERLPRGVEVWMRFVLI